MIDKFSDYETTEAYRDYEQLPKGGYILKIVNTELGTNTNGQYVILSCDIAEGEYKNFFARDYNNQSGQEKKWHCNYWLNVPKDNGTEQDGWTKRRFKTVTTALEESNAGYHFDWDETKFKGKLIGGLFNEREYEGQDGKIKKATNLASLCNVEKIRSGNFTVPKDKLLEGRQGQAAKGPDDFMSIDDASLNDELPFA